MVRSIQDVLAHNLSCKFFGKNRNATHKNTELIMETCKEAGIGIKVNNTTCLIISGTKNFTLFEYVTKIQGYVCSYVYVNRSKATGVQI
jgi:hypothetical protein